MGEGVVKHSETWPEMGVQDSLDSLRIHPRKVKHEMGVNASSTNKKKKILSRFPLSPMYARDLINGSFFLCVYRGGVKGESWKLGNACHWSRRLSNPCHRMASKPEKMVPSWNEFIDYRRGNSHVVNHSWFHVSRTKDLELFSGEGLVRFAYWNSDRQQWRPCLHTGQRVRAGALFGNDWRVGSQEGNYRTRANWGGQVASNIQEIFLEVGGGQRVRRCAIVGASRPRWRVGDE